MQTKPAFDLDDIRVLHMETSSVCNAACPQCARETDPNFNKRTDGRSLSLAQVQERFDPVFISQLDRMFMCGNYGDPAAAPECIDIFRYFRSHNDKIALEIHSNGGLRSKEWWAELGTVLNGPQDYCHFGIDGLEDTNHIYRVNTVWPKIIENAQSFIANGGKAIWVYLIFEHNEHQVERAQQLAQELGFAKFQPKVSRRFRVRPVEFLRPPRNFS
jgi:sulfatase maturation enzyme AslB (radical SAM superfamily)